MFSQSSIAENKCMTITNMTLRSAKKVKLKNDFTCKIYTTALYIEGKDYGILSQLIAKGGHHTLFQKMT